MTVLPGVMGSVQIHCDCSARCDGVSTCDCLARCDGVSTCDCPVRCDGVSTL